MSKKFLNYFSIIIIAIGLIFMANGLILAWTAPASSPPDDNAFTPINIGDTAQRKTGKLNIGTGLDYWITKDGDSFALENNAGNKYFAVGQDGALCLDGDCITEWPSGGSVACADCDSRFVKQSDSGSIEIESTNGDIDIKADDNVNIYGDGSASMNTDGDILIASGDDMEIYSPSGKHIILQYANGNPSATGYVGIKTGSPSYELDVNGTIRGDNVAPSDIRLKENILTIDNALEKIANIRGVYFDWKDKDKDKIHNIGIIAQEIEEILPEVVYTDKQGYKSIDYGKLTGVLIESIKELQLRIEKLENE